MFSMRVYSEAKRGGGEDAYPLVTNAGIFVADGLGGSAGIPVVQFAPTSFKSQELEKILFSCLQVAPEVKAEFSAYVRRSYSDSLANANMQQIYTQKGQYDIYKLKNSGFVGSHALGTALSVELFAMVAHNSTSYDKWRKQIMDFHQGTNIFATRIYPHYLRVIEALGAKLAQVDIDAMKLTPYGTTVAGCFYRESSDYVDVCFYSCGDSRLYVWDKLGFRQAVDDQGRSGRVGEQISEKKEPKIAFSFQSLRKPCAIIAMTDGVYKAYGGENAYHSTPLVMEGHLLSLFKSAKSPQDAEVKLQDFLQPLLEDDSASFALAAFGYENYTDFSEKAQMRLRDIVEEYKLEDVPEDFLTVDYRGANEKIAYKQKDVCALYGREHFWAVSKSKWLDVECNGWWEA